jgi:hypothetical protein
MKPMTNIEIIEQQQRIVQRIVSDIANLTTIYHNNELVVAEIDKLLKKWDLERVENIKVIELFKEIE